MPAATKTKDDGVAAKKLNGEYLPPVRSDDPVIAIACSDLHLSERAPSARVHEDEWFDAMARPLSQLKSLQEMYGCPVLCAGDIFDKWNSSAELINFTIEHLPEDFIAIPGQHDLAYHSTKVIDRTAFWTLAAARSITPLLQPGSDYCNIGDDGIDGNGFCTVVGFPFGHGVEAPVYTNDILIALIHEYTWIPGKSYPDAPKKGNAATKGDWQGYDICITGDNHIPFIIRCSKTLIYNPGSLMRRHADQVDHHPEVGLIHKSKRITRYRLDISKDIIDSAPDGTVPLGSGAEMAAFMQDLASLTLGQLDFREAMKRVLRVEDPPEEVQRAVLEAMGEGNGRPE
jgi:DNA repair exonuclease SbcCD nuclease subunit